MTSKEKLKYYIIKDLDTGLYYRGKGQNRWGKYYNQASIFRNLVQANNSVEQLKIYDKSNAVAIENEITELTQKPTLDECIKEWKEKGYAILNRKPELTIESKHYDLCIRICKANLIYEISNYYEDKPACILPELHYLITKTLKALEGMKDE